jgi:hypothetical protein
MPDSKERRQIPRKPTHATPRPDIRAAASSGVQAQTAGDDTRRRIAEAAYFRAKERNFEPGHELEDWVEAESEVMGRINGSAR